MLDSGECNTHHLQEAAMMEQLCVTEAHGLTERVQCLRHLHREAHIAFLGLPGRSMLPCPRPPEPVLQGKHQAPPEQHRHAQALHIHLLSQSLHLCLRQTTTVCTTCLQLWQIVQPDRYIRSLLMACRDQHTVCRLTGAPQRVCTKQ